MNDVLKRIYGPFFQEEPDKDVQDKPFTATLSFEHKTVTEEQKQQILQTFPLVRRNLFLGAFEYAFDKAISKEEEKRYFEPIVLPYRKDETIYILPPEKASSLRVCYTLKFQDAEDIVFANKVFLQEFKDSRRNKALNNAPTVAFTQASKPGDLKLVDEKKKITREGDDPESLKEYSFIIIALFNQHMSLESRATNIDKLISYRSYFHYHLKCSKAYLHFRMRSRFAELEKRNSDAQDRFDTFFFFETLFFEKMSNSFIISKTRNENRKKNCIRKILQRKEIRKKFQKKQHAFILFFIILFLVFGLD